MPIHRDDLGGELERLGLRGVGAEVGVRGGAHADVILGNWSGHLLMVDPWRQLPDYPDPANVTDEDQERRYQRARAIADKHQPRGHLLRMLSCEAAALLRPASLVLVYLDAQHTRPGIVDDLEAWYLLLKRGGIFAGHDYFDGSFDMKNKRPSDDPLGEFPCHVKTAVDLFARNAGATVHVTDDTYPSWWWVK